MMGEMRYFQGTLTPLVIGSRLFWVCMSTYIVCIGMQRYAHQQWETDEVTFVRLTALQAPGALYSFFITGQLGRAYTRWEKTREDCRKANINIIALTLMLTGGRPNPEQLALVRKIVKCLLSSLLITYINVCDYLRDLAPPSKYMVVHGLLTEEEAATEKWRNTHAEATTSHSHHHLSPHHRLHTSNDRNAPPTYMCGELKLQHAAELIEDAKGLGLKCHFGPGFLAKFTTLAELLQGLENTEDDTIAPSLHLFSSLFTLIYLPLLSIAMAQHVADYENLDAWEHATVSGLGFMAVSLTTFAFLGIFHLVGAMSDPFGTDSIDMPSFMFYEECVARTDQLLARAASHHDPPSPSSARGSGGSKRRPSSVLLASPRSVSRIANDAHDSLTNYMPVGQAPLFETGSEMDSEEGGSRYRGIGMGMGSKGGAHAPADMV
jgi:hypothetical protein